MLNIEYQKKLKDYRQLPFWKRIWTKKPIRIDSP